MERRPPYSLLIWARWIGESINSLLPAAQVGGYLAKARLLVQRGIPGPVSGSSVVTELSVGVLTQIVFTLIGVYLLLDLGERELVKALLLGLGILSLLMTGFFLAQRYGMFGGFLRILARMAGERGLQGLVGGAEALDAAILEIYRNHRTVLLASLWSLFGWIAGAGEVWLALHFLGAPVSAKNALLLESLGSAVRGAAFLVPGALGVQEGGYLMLGRLVGLSPEISLALSLTKRVRELLLGLPALMAWQVAEGRQFWRRWRRILRNIVSRQDD